MINPSEIKPGMYITVDEWLSHKDDSWKGDVIKVLAVDLPFIATELTNSLLGRRKHSFDTRCTSFKELSQEYVEAMLPDTKS